MNQELLHTIAGPIIDGLGLDAVALMALFSVLSIVSRLIGKTIPDNATGALALIRKIAKIIGLYTQNRVTTSGDEATMLRGNSSARTR